MPILKDLPARAKASNCAPSRYAAGVEMSAQILDIAQRYRPDFVLAHLFGRSPSAAIKGLKQLGLSVEQGAWFRLGIVGSATSRRPAGGVAQGYHTMQFSGVGH